MSSVVSVAKTHTVICTACEQSVPSVGEWQPFPENGWIMRFDDFGYYSGFTDNIEAQLDERISRRWFLCHDCVVKFLTLFPNLARSVDRGGHCRSENATTPCCAWEWRIGENGKAEIVGDNGEWVEIEKG